MVILIAWLNAFLRQEDAPTFLEYGLLVIAIALAVVAAAGLFGVAVNNLFVDAANAF